MRRRADRIDDNQNDIVKLLRDIPGVTVEPSHDDILVGYRGKTYWYEIKRPDQLKKSGAFRKDALKPSQIKLLDEWRGHYRVVTSFDEIRKDIFNL